MPNSDLPEYGILFMNNLAGDDLWEHGHLMMPQYEKFSAPLELVKFRRSVRATYNSSGVHVTSMPYTIPDRGKVQLYGFPFLTIDVDPFDVEYPKPIQGLVITQDMRMFDYFMEKDPRFFEIADLAFSRLAWAQTENLPTVVAVHHADGHAGDLEALRKLVGTDLYCPVIWHHGETDATFLHRAVTAVFSEIMQIGGN